MNITLDDGRTELWQWDTGRKIVVDDKSVSEVHYSKYSSTQAITREVINGKAEIPNYLLQDTHDVTVYAYSGSIENGYTVAEKTFSVAKKPKPANYVETKEDQAILAKLKEEIGDLSELQTEAKDNLVSAINEAAASGADWAQNDPDGDGYVANRPGGYDVIETRKILETTLVSADDDMNMVVADADFFLAEGDSVYVSIGGAPEVTCKVFMTTETDGGPAALYSFGSKSYDEISTGGFAATDYIVWWYGNSGKMVCMRAAGSDLVGKTIVARANVATPVKIPDKYLELGSAKEIVLFTIDYNRSDDTYVSDRTYEELATALNSGKLVVAKFGNVGMGELYSYGLLCQAGMYVEGLFVYVTSNQPYRWYCTKGNVWTKRRLLNLEMEIEMPFYEEDVGNVLTQVKSSGEYYKYKYAPKSIAGYGVKYIAEGYIGENNEFICTTSSEEVIRRCSEIDDGCLCAIRIIDEDSYTIAIAEGGLCGDKGMIFSRVHTDYHGNLYTHWCSLNIESDTVSWSTYKHENITNNYYVELDGVYPNYTLSSATPIQDIKTAYVNGKTLFCRCIIEGYTAVLPLFVPGPTNNLWLFSGSGGISIGSLGFYPQYFTIAVTPNGVMAEHEIIATKEYADNKEVVVKSSTAGSTKKFKITVNDTGALSAVEVT